MWWGVLYYRRDGIFDKIEALCGAGDIYSYVIAFVWFLPVTLLILGFHAETKYVHRERREAFDKCVNCGYDLRGSQERCPECGTGFSK